MTLTEDAIAGEGILEPVEAMAEAALALCTSDRDGLNGGVHKSLTLLEQLGRPVRTLDGGTLLEVSQSVSTSSRRSSDPSARFCIGTLTVNHD